MKPPIDAATLTPALFRGELRRRGHTIRSFAHVCGMNRSTVANWGKPRNGVVQAFPQWVPLVLCALDCIERIKDAV